MFFLMFEILYLLEDDIVVYSQLFYLWKEIIVVLRKLLDLGLKEKGCFVSFLFILSFFFKVFKFSEVLVGVIIIFQLSVDKLLCCWRMVFVELFEKLVLLNQ